MPSLQVLELGEEFLDWGGLSVGDAGNIERSAEVGNVSSYARMNFLVIGLAADRVDESGDLHHLRLAHAHGRHRWCP